MLLAIELEITLKSGNSSAEEIKQQPYKTDLRARSTTLRVAAGIEPAHMRFALHRANETGAKWKQMFRRLDRHLELTQQNLDFSSLGGRMCYSHVRMMRVQAVVADDVGLGSPIPATPGTIAWVGPPCKAWLQRHSE